MTKAAELTKTKATSQARRIADRTMPGEQMFVSTAGSWDLWTNKHLMITEISIPTGHEGGKRLAEALRSLAGFRSVEHFPSLVRVTREA